MLSWRNLLCGSVETMRGTRIITNDDEKSSFVRREKWSLALRHQSPGSHFVHCRPFCSEFRSDELVRLIRDERYSIQAEIPRRCRYTTNYEFVLHHGDESAVSLSFYMC